MDEKEVSWAAYFLSPIMRHDMSQDAHYAIAIVMVILLNTIQHSNTTILGPAIRSFTKKAGSLESIDRMQPITAYTFHDKDARSKGMYLLRKFSNHGRYG